MSRIGCVDCQALPVNTREFRVQILYQSDFYKRIMTPYKSQTKDIDQIIESTMESSHKLKFDVSPSGKITEFDKGSHYVQLDFLFKTEKNKGASLLNTNQHILIVVDKSGSMAGSAITSAKQGIVDMIRYLGQADCNNLTLIEYQSTANKTQMDKLSLDDRIKAVQKINAGGGTSFKHAFKEIQRSILQKKSKDIKVIFFTDGQDGGAMASLGDLREFIRTCQQTEFHTVGFTQNHQVKLLTELTLIGNKPGTFQYCKNTSDIKQCVQSITGLVGNASVVGSVLIGKQSIPLDLDQVSHQDQVWHYKTNLFIGHAELGSGLQITFTVGEITKQVFVNKDSLATNELADTNPAFLRLIFIKNQMTKILKDSLDLNKGNTLDKELYNRLIKQIEEKNEELDSLSNQASKMKNHQRKQFFPSLFEAKELVSQFYSKLKELQSGQMTNDKIASLNALAYRKMTKKGLQKKMDVRTQNNIVVINRSYQIVKDLVNKIDTKALYDQYSDLCSKIGQCIYSANNFIEALKDQDCLCLTYDVSRSEAAVMDPTQIIIKEVFPSFIGVSSFLTSAEYAILNNPLAHGGFQKKNQGEIIKGVARESITGVLPLYICKENWSVARQLMKPALGWTVTLDPLGYAYAQIKTVPFLVLSKLYNMVSQGQTSEFIRFQIQLVEETCTHIIKEASEEKAEVKLNQEITKLFKSYISDPLVRTIDSIPNNQVFIVQIYLLSKMKELELPSEAEMKQFFLAIQEQEMRRRTKHFEAEDNVNTILYGLLNVDTEKYVIGPFKNYVEILNSKGGDKNQNSEHAFKFQLLIDGQGLVQKQADKVQEIQPAKDETKENNSSKPKTEQVQYEIILTNHQQYLPSQVSAVEELSKVQKYAQVVLNLAYLFGLPPDPIKLDLTPESGEFLLALYIQNKLGARNADRRQNITNKEYMNPFTHAKQYIRKLYISLAQAEKLKKINEYLSQSSSNAFAQIANQWAMSTNPLEAGGLIYGIKIGSSLSFYLQALCLGIAPLFKQKLEMLIYGQFLGVNLYGDTYADGSIHKGWSASKKHSNALIRNNFAKLSRAEWKKILPKLQEKFLDELEGKSN